MAEQPVHADEFSEIHAVLLYQMMMMDHPKKGMFCVNLARSAKFTHIFNPFIETIPDNRILSRIPLETMKQYAPI